MGIFYRISPLEIDGDLRVISVGEWHSVWVLKSWIPKSWLIRLSHSGRNWMIWGCEHGPPWPSRNDVDVFMFSHERFGDFPVRLNVYQRQSIRWWLLGEYPPAWETMVFESGVDMNNCIWAPEIHGLELLLSGCAPIAESWISRSKECKLMDPLLN